MSELDPDAAAWAAAQFGPDAAVIESLGLRDGGSPWSLLISSDDRTHRAILRVGDHDDIETTRLERAAMIWAREHAIPVPAVLSADGPEPLLLVEPVSGSSSIPVERSTAGCPSPPPTDSCTAISGWATRCGRRTTGWWP